jgi:hypothetical protein
MNQVPVNESYYEEPEPTNFDESQDQYWSGVDVAYDEMRDNEIAILDAKSDKMDDDIGRMLKSIFRGKQYNVWGIHILWGDKNSDFRKVYIERRGNGWKNYNPTREEFYRIIQYARGRSWDRISHDYIGGSIPQWSTYFRSSG